MQKLGTLGERDFGNNVFIEKGNAIHIYFHYPKAILSVVTLINHN